jgi:hypothetical protein
MTQMLNESAAQITGSGVPLTARATGLAKGIGRSMDAAARGTNVGRQLGARALLSDQESRGTAPMSAQVEIPEVSQPMSIDDLQITRSIDPRFAQQQMNLRERAKSNPYIASTLLGGLGSAGLL